MLGDVVGPERFVLRSLSLLITIIALPSSDILFVVRSLHYQGGVFYLELSGPAIALPSFSQRLTISKQ